MPREDEDYAIESGLRMLSLRRLVAEDADGKFAMNPDELALVKYYANSIAHLRRNAEVGRAI